MDFRLALAQINSTVGDLAGNRERILRQIEQARDLGVDLVAFPELALTGYPPEDLLLIPDFLDDVQRTLRELAPASRGLTVVLGAPYLDDAPRNAAVILHDGAIVGIASKQQLPNCGAFDEHRYFRAGDGSVILDHRRLTVGISIGEDIWDADGPPLHQARHGADLLLNISASPYYRGKGADRERMLATRAADNLVYVACCNLVGGQDELVFDGLSVVCAPDGTVIARARQFEEELLVADIDRREIRRARLYESRWRTSEPRAESGVERIALRECDRPTPRAVASTWVAPVLEPVEEVYRALVTATRDYVRKNGFTSVVLGLSGGVDSSLVAAIAADALGPEHVTGVAMPTRYSSSHSLEDAEALARNLGIGYHVVPIDGTFQSYLDMLQGLFGDRPPDMTEENIQPRIRGTLLMALSNKFGWLVLTTGNKSEVAVGYSTLYGDTAGGFAVIKDVPKMLVYELCRYRNAIAGYDLIPERVLVKAPSAELRPDQKDSDSLPEYAMLDPIIEAFVEHNRSAREIVELGYDRDTVQRVLRMISRNEYKRRQSPPGTKITPRAFGKDWRLPITHQYRL